MSDRWSRVTKDPNEAPGLHSHLTQLLPPPLTPTKPCGPHPEHLLPYCFRKGVLNMTIPKCREPHLSDSEEGLEKAWGLLLTESWDVLTAGEKL